MALHRCTARPVEYLVHVRQNHLKDSTCQKSLEILESKYRFHIVSALQAALGQHWASVGPTLARRWSDIGPHVLGQRRANVGK